MRVHVRLFAAARELAGEGHQDLDLPEGATLGTLQALLEARYQGIRDVVQCFAVNRQFATSETPLHAGDEVACIPPVGGG